jgi:transcriptional regulator with XRE-family HTH domain
MTLSASRFRYSGAVTDADDEQHLRSALGKAIRLRRTELDMGRADLAREAGVSYTYVSEIENGTKQASSKTLWRIARALGLEPHELMALAAQWDSRPPAQPSPGAVPAAQRAVAPDWTAALGATARLALPDAPKAARSPWFHGGRPSASDPGVDRPSGSAAGPPELVEVLDRLAAALDGVPNERAELALMLALDERRTRRIVREELDAERRGRSAPPPA